MNHKANLFVVGAMKAGTTSFVDLLSQNEEVYVPPIKEPHYFVNKLPKSIYKPSRFFDLNTYFEKQFPKPLHIAKLNNSVQYEKLFSLAQPKHKYLVDASTCYLNSPESAELILNYNPKAKIIILLRDPLKRAVSHYHMDVGLGRTLRSFEAEILDNIEAYKNGVLSGCSYLSMSLYKEQVENFKTYFGKQVLVLQFENLVRKDMVEFEKLNQFLALNDKLVNLPVQNKTRKLYFPKLNNILIKIGVKDVFSKIVPGEIKQALFRLISSQRKSEIQISEETRNVLKLIFDDKSTFQNHLER